MSSRVLKKLQGPSDLDILKDSLLEDDDEDVEDIGGRAAKGKNFNPFDLLNQQSQSDSDGEADEQANDDDDQAAAAPAQSAAKKNKKNKKKRKKKGAAAAAAAPAAAADDTDATVAERYEDIAEAAPQKLATKKLAPAAVTSKQEDTKDLAGASSSLSEDAEQRKLYGELLQVEVRHLNAQNEMRRTFGRTVVKTEAKRGRKKFLYKSAHIISPKDTWPSVPKDFLTMAVDRKDKEFTWYRFQHSAAYQKVQRLFQMAMDRLDPDTLTPLVRYHPYHVDSLLALSEFFKANDSLSVADDLVQRAVLVYETALSYNLTSGKCYLDYKWQENRGFFIALFRHAVHLESRACSRTALEVAKVLYNLDPIADPLAMVLVIDYYALRSNQCMWLLQFFDTFHVSRNLLQLPNMAFSFALAIFKLKGECEEADMALRYALLMFPSMLLPLLDEIKQTLDNRVHDCAYFKADKYASEALQQLVALYICRAHVVWRDSKLPPWLQRVALEVVRLYELGDRLIEEYRKKRKARYVAPPRNILRHVFLSDFKERVPLACFLQHHDQPIQSHDPLPPVNNVSSYPRAAAGTASGPASSRPPRTLSMFFQSMMPSYVAPTEPAGDDDGAEADFDLETAALAILAMRTNDEQRAGGGGAPGGGMDNEASDNDEDDDNDDTFPQVFDDGDMGNGLAPFGESGGPGSVDLRSHFNSFVVALRNIMQNFDVSVTENIDGEGEAANTAAPAGDGEEGGGGGAAAEGGAAPNEDPNDFDSLD